MVGEHPDGFHLGVVEQVGLVDDQDGGAAAFGVFSGQGVGGLGYYAANAAGRLLGITLSGVLYQFAGITGCLIGSAVMLLLCSLITFLLPLNAGLPTARPASV